MSEFLRIETNKARIYIGKKSKHRVKLDGCATPGALLRNALLRRGNVSDDRVLADLSLFSTNYQSYTRCAAIHQMMSALKNLFCFFSCSGAGAAAV